MTASTEIALRGGASLAAALEAKALYAERLSYAGMLPAQYRKQPANVLWAIEYGETLGLTPMAAINGVHVIEGKPSASAALISGLVRRAGHKLRVSGTGLRATAQIIRCDDPDYVYEVTWELRRNAEGNPNAEEAGLLGKGVWKNYPAAMLKSRAITQVARDACEEILFGLHYTPEELGAEVDDEGAPVEVSVRREVVAERRVERSQASAGVVDEWTQPASAEPDTGAEQAPAADKASPAQIRKISAMMRDWSREERLQATAAIIGREVTTSKDLTKREASMIIDAVAKGAQSLRDRVRQGAELPAQDPEPQVEIVDAEVVPDLDDVLSGSDWAQAERAEQAREALVADFLTAINGASRDEMPGVAGQIKAAYAEGRISADDRELLLAAYTGRPAVAVDPSPEPGQSWSHDRLAAMTGARL